MSILNTVRDKYEGYFLEEDVDVAAWINKVAADIPRTTFMYQLKVYQMKVVFGSCINFEMAFNEFDKNSFIPHHQTMQWITDVSTPLQVGSQIRKGCKNDSQVLASVKLPTGPEFLSLILKHCSLSIEQIYTQIIPYMERDNEKWPCSATGSEHAAYMQIHQCAPAPNKGKKPMTGSLQSRIAAHAQQLARTALPYDEVPPSRVPDVEMNALVMTGVRSTFHDESAIHLDTELDDIYD
ncbi:hypothetical protein M422DRAFT_254167 [Sphaerobolus stellatus SS14]|uniref:Uncharacterized protein n=1 Tax=Sphaerobolus stellatus (strain SS14) TaxID=990650 RepID=A0A0C9UI20_SPHS4|nr:hypothetical protein M422DRAFT_254167 [Sphaerobolus stellatus SS14]